jgi:hypothetical protein
MDQAVIERFDPAAVQRELTEAIERTESLGLAIEAHLHDIERELEDIRRINSALAS